MIKKYTVQIEQPMLVSFVIEAEDDYKAEEIATQKFNKLSRVEFNTLASYGTDYQTQTLDEKGEAITDWH